MTESKAENKMKGKKSDDSKEGSGTDEYDSLLKSLFAKENRYFSHGCMRVQYPEQLAQVILGRQGWSGTRIANQIGSGKRRIVNLKQHIPVHVTYLTSWANKDGSVHFRDDVYGRDKILAKALSRK